MIFEIWSESSLTLNLGSIVISKLGFGGKPLSLPMGFDFSMHSNSL